MKLRYIERIDLAGGGTKNTVDYIMRMNSVYDPNQSGTGHQPYLHDQLAIYWTRYIVRACKWRVDVRQVSGTERYLLWARVGEALSAESSATIGEKMIETGSCKWKWMKPVDTYIGRSGVTSIRGYNKMKKLQTTPDEDQYGAAFGANPSRSINMQFGTSTDGIETNGFECVVYMTFWVEVREPIAVATS